MTLRIRHPRSPRRRSSWRRPNSPSRESASASESALSERPGWSACTRWERITAAAILALAIVLDAWLAALIVGVVYGAIAGVLALTGKQKVEEATPPVPEQAIESTKADVQHTTQRAKEARP